MGLRLNEEFDVTFRVDKVLNKNSYNYTKFTYTLVDFSGYTGQIAQSGKGIGYFMNIYEGDQYKSRAKFIESSYDGYLLKLEGIAMLKIPGTAMELARYAAKNINGVSVKTMQKVIDWYGSDFISILNEDPEKIKVIPGITSVRKDKILKWCNEHDLLENLIIQLLTYGISAKETIKIYKKYGRVSLFQIEANPYSLYKYGCLSFRDIDKLVAQRNLADAHSSERIQCALLAYIDFNESNGDMCVKEETIMNKFNDYLQNNSGFKNTSDDPILSPMDIKLNLSQLLNDDYIVKYNANDIIVYYKKENFQIENTCAKFIGNILHERSYLNAERKKIESILNNDTKLSPKQKEAVFTCLTHKFSILTGGPGTGKTFSIQYILRIIEMFLNMFGETPKVTLVAPTGKAAGRMYEVTKHEATTIHSALHIMPDNEFNPDNEYKLKTDWIIIDEASMIDEKLFAYMIEHISDNANIILCGDSDQLPSVGPGDVLGQLLKSKLIAHVELDKIFRQGGNANTIVDYAHLIKTAKQEDINKIDLSIKTRDFEFIEVDTDIAIADKILQIYRSLIHNRVSPDSIMVLTPVHKTATGTDILNKVIQKEYNPNVKDNKCKFFEGDRIIQLKNNKELDIHNGDLGTIVSVYKNTDNETEEINYCFDIQFDDKEDPIFIEGDSEIDLAYAMTIHKSQGSEVEYVIMPFSKLLSLSRMLNNRLIYTGLTRAKTKFIGVGSSLMFKRGCLQKDLKVRKTLLSFMIKKIININ